MHPADKLQFERVAREYSQWRSVPEEERSPAPAWWWQPAIQVLSQDEEMPALSCYQARASCWIEVLCGRRCAHGADRKANFPALAGRIPTEAEDGQAPLKCA
jgi:hypothetical protein